MSLKKRHFPKYRQNLHYMSHTEGADGRTLVYSYNTLVAVQDGQLLIEQGYWSTTTRKHVNYAATELGLQVKHWKL
jgi:hypothetical protein